MATIATILASCGALVAKLRTKHESTATDFVPVDIVEVVSSAVAIAKSTFRRHSNARLVDVRLPTNLPLVAGQPDELLQVLLNLILNAFEASPSRSRVSVTGHEEAGAVVVRVDDRGQGIPSEHLHRIFAPYFTTKGRNGTGLGLAIARDIITGHGGTIRALNVPDRGARFEVRLRRWSGSAVIGSVR